MDQLVFASYDGSYDGNLDVERRAKRPASKSASQSASQSESKQVTKVSRFNGYGGRAATSMGRTIDCPGFHGKLNCECGRVWILMHANGKFFYFDSNLPIGDSAIRALCGPLEKDIYYFDSLEAAHMVLLRIGCKLHGGELPSFVTPEAKLGGVVPSKRLKTAEALLFAMSAKRLSLALSCRGRV